MASESLHQNFCRHQSRHLLPITVILLLSWISGGSTRRLRSINDLENNPLTNSVEFIWSTTTVAVGDTAVLHCSFDAIFQQLRTGTIDWYREPGLPSSPAVVATPSGGSQNVINVAGAGSMVRKRSTSTAGDGSETVSAIPVATGKRVVTDDGRYRVYRPHNSALSVLIIRRAKKRDAGIYRCNVAGSSTRHKYMVLNVTESKIEAQTSSATQRAKIGSDVTLWCNASGYPKPVVYWTREDRHKQLPDGSHQYWGNGLQLKSVSESDTGIYACYLDNFVQPIVSYKFSLMVEDNPWNLDGYKMRFDSKQWYPQDSPDPKPVKAKSFLLMCETREASKPLPIIRWYRDGNAVRNSRHFYIIEDSGNSGSSYASSTLVIMTFLPRFQGNYTCVASNVFRMKKLTFYIHDYHHSDDVADDVTVASTATAKAPIINLPRLVHLGAAAAAAAAGGTSKDTALPSLIPKLSFHSLGGAIKLNNSGIQNNKKPKEQLSFTPLSHVSISSSPPPKMLHGITTNHVKTTPSPLRGKSDIIEKLTKTVSLEDEDAAAGSGSDDDDDYK